MGAEIQLLALGGVPLGPGTPFDALLPWGTDRGYRAGVELVGRHGRPPRRDGLVPEARELPFSVAPTPESTLDPDDFHAQVHRIFSPYAGLRTLVALHPDGETQLHLDVDVVEFRAVDDLHYEGRFVAPDPIWRAATPTTVAPGTITVPGTMPVRPVIEVSGGAELDRYRVTVSDRFGQGLAGYPLAISLGQGWNPADVMVIHGLRPVPFYLDSERGLLWVRVDVPAGGAAIVDVFHGEAVANGVTAQALDLGTLDPTQSTATTWIYPEQALSRANRYHGGTGSFTVGRSIVQTASGMTFGWYGNALRVAPSDYGSAVYDAMPNDYDSLVLVSGVPMTSISVTFEAYAGLRNLDAEALEEWVGYGAVRLSARAVGEETWQLIQAWFFGDGRLPRRYTETWSLNGAVEVALGVLGYSPSDRPAKLDIPGEDEPQDGTRHLRPFLIMTIRGDWTVTLDPDRVPAVDISEPIDAQRLDVVLRNQTTGDFVQLSEVYLDRVTLTIDPNSGQVTPASGVPPVGREILFGDAANLFTLAPGTNTVTATGADVSLTYRPGWAL